jgi:hypothetical protein
VGKYLKAIINQGFIKFIPKAGDLELITILQPISQHNIGQDISYQNQIYSPLDNHITHKIHMGLVHPR